MPARRRPWRTCAACRRVARQTRSSSLTKAQPHSRWAARRRSPPLAAVLRVVHVLGDHRLRAVARVVVRGRVDAEAALDRRHGRAALLDEVDVDDHLDRLKELREWAGGARVGEDAGERAASGCAARTSVSPAAARSPKVRMNQRRASRMHAMPRNLPRAGFQPPRARLLDQAPAVRGQSPARYLTRRSRPTSPTPRRPARLRTLTRPPRPPNRPRRRSWRC